MTAETATFGVDTVKIRLQIQGQVIDESLRKLKYRGTLHAFWKITREEGFLALYSGLKPALFRQGVYGGLNIGLYHAFKHTLSGDAKDETLGRNLLAGAMAGSLSSTLCTPTDVLKVRLQAHTITSTKERMFAAFGDIYRTEGLRGLYRGVVPTATRATIVTSVELPGYDFAKRCILDYDLLCDNEITYFISSAFAGICAALASTPVDTIKTRMMNQVTVCSETGEIAKLYKGSMDCFVRTWKTEGPLALYKGLVPTCCRMIPWNIVFFISLEEYKKIAGLYRDVP